MTDDMQKSLQESLEEWSDIEKHQAEREKKDRKIISRYCADNDPADITRTIKLLSDYKGLASHDKDVVDNFSKDYPHNLSTKLIYDFEDVKDIYSQYLESGGCDDD